MSQRTQTTTVILYIGLCLFAVFGIYDSFFGAHSFTEDAVVFAAVLTFAYIFFEKLNLSTTLFSLLIIAMQLHLAGTFGFYGTSPLFIPWDYVTHFFPMLITSMAFFSLLQKFMSEHIDVKTIFLILIALFATMGVGSLIENLEFYGYMTNGFGGGAFAFGDGDAFPGQKVADDIESFVGGWFNTMWDLVNNLLGAVLGVLIMTVKTFAFKKQEQKVRKQIVFRRNS